MPGICPYRLATTGAAHGEITATGGGSDDGRDDVTDTGRGLLLMVLGALIIIGLCLIDDDENERK